MDTWICVHDIKPPLCTHTKQIMASQAAMDAFLFASSWKNAIDGNCHGNPPHLPVTLDFFIVLVALDICMSWVLARFMVFFMVLAVVVFGWLPPLVFFLEKPSMCLPLEESVAHVAHRTYGKTLLACLKFKDAKVAMSSWPIISW